MKKELLSFVEENRLRKEMPGSFRIGDLVRIWSKIIEGDSERLQPFEGIVIRRKGSGLNETFTARKISYGVGVEKTFPLHSPLITKLEIIRSGRVRRAKLYYLRKKLGKAGRIEEKSEVKTEEKKAEAATV